MEIGILGKVDKDRMSKCICSLEKDYTIHCLKDKKTKDKKFFKNRYIKRILSSLIIGIRLIPVLIKSDIVIIPSGSWNFSKIIFARLFRKKVICDFYLSLYDTVVNDRKNCSERSLKARIYLYRDRVALKHSNLVLFLNPAEAIHYTNVVGIDLNKVTYSILPICRNEKNFASLPYFKHNTDKVCLCWVGSFIPLHGLDKIIYACKILKESNINFKLYIFGPKGKIYKGRSSCIKMVNELSLNDNVEFFDDWDDINKNEAVITKHCDICMGIFGDSEKAKNVLANKVVDGTAFKMPVLTAESNAVYNYFNGINDIYVSENDPEAIANGIINIMKLPEDTIVKNIENAYMIYKQNFSYESFNDKLKKIVKELTN